MSGLGSAAPPADAPGTDVSVGTLARSSTYAAVSSFWQIGSRLFLTPLILAKIGLEGYGVWTLLFSIAGPINTVGASFGLAYAKFTAEHDARRDTAGLNRLLGSAVVLAGGIALLGVTGLWLARRALLGSLGVPAEMLGAAADALMLVGATILLQLSVGCVTQVVAGLQRTDLRHKALILSSLVYFCAAMLLLERGWGLVGLAASYLAGEAVAIGVCWIWCRRLRPGIRLSPFLATREGIRSVVSLGGRFQFLYLLTQMSSVSFSMLLSALLGPASLGIYQLALRLVRLGEAGANAILTPMMPAFANLDARGDRARADALYRQGSRIVLAAALVSFGFLAVFADDVVRVWTNRNYPLVAWTLRVLGAAFVAKHLTGMGTARLRGRGRLRLELNYSLVTLAVLWGSLAPLTAWLGYRGMILATALALGAGAVWFLREFHRLEALRFGPFFREVVVRPALVLAPVIAATAALAAWLQGPSAIGVSRWALLAELALWGAAFGLLAGASTWWLILSRGERGRVLAGARARLAPRSAAADAELSK